MGGLHFRCIFVMTVCNLYISTVLIDVVFVAESGHVDVFVVITTGSIFTYDGKEKLSSDCRVIIIQVFVYAI